MSSAQSFQANDRVAQALGKFATEQELNGLGNIAITIIVAELRRAGFQDQVEDVFQNALLITWQCCCSGAVRKVPQFFKAVSRHEARKAMRSAIRRERSISRLQAWMQLLSGEVCLPEEPADDERELILKTLPKLSPMRQKVIKLMMEGLDDAQIVTETGLNSNAFRAMKCRAIQDLRNALAAEVAGAGSEGSEWIH